MTLNGVMAVTMRYFTEFGNCLPSHNRVDLWRNSCTSLWYFVLRERCRRDESSRSLSHLLMSFLYVSGHEATEFREIMQLGGNYAAHGHLRSPILVPIESLYTTSY